MRVLGIVENLGSTPHPVTVTTQEHGNVQRWYRTKASFATVTSNSYWMGRRRFIFNQIQIYSSVILFMEEIQRSPLERYKSLGLKKKLWKPFTLFPSSAASKWHAHLTVKESNNIAIINCQYCYQHCQQGIFLESLEFQLGDMFFQMSLPKHCYFGYLCYISGTRGTFWRAFNQTIHN